MGGCFYQPFRNPQGGSCMAGYLCPMPIGILFMLTAPIFNFSSLIFHLDASGILFMLTAPIFNFSSLIFHLDASGIFLCYITIHKLLALFLQTNCL